jgi:hypothetical protein
MWKGNNPTGNLALGCSQLNWHPVKLEFVRLIRSCRNKIDVSHNETPRNAYKPQGFEYFKKTVGGWLIFSRILIITAITFWQYLSVALGRDL